MTGPSRPPDAPPCARAIAREAEKAAARAALGGRTPEPDGPGGHTAAGPRGSGGPSDWPLPLCSHGPQAGTGRVAYACCAGCKAHELTVWATGGHPFPLAPGVLACGHRMDDMILSCSDCTGFVVDLVARLGGPDAVVGLVRPYGGPVSPANARAAGVSPEYFLRTASHPLVRRLMGGGASALCLRQALHAAATLDTFFGGEAVMGLADGDLTAFRRLWTYELTGHLEAPNTAWKWRPCKLVARALRVDDEPMATVPAMQVAAHAPGSSGDGAPSRTREGDRDGRDRSRKECGGGKCGCGARCECGARRDADAGTRRSDSRGSDRSRERRKRSRHTRRRPRRNRRKDSSDSRSSGRSSERRGLSEPPVALFGSAFRTRLGSALRGRIIDVEEGPLVPLTDSRGRQGCGLVTAAEWLRRYADSDHGAGEGAGPMASSAVHRSSACSDRVGSPLCRPDGDALDTDVPGSSTTGAATSRATSTESARTDPPGPPGDGGGADWIPRGPDGRPTYWSSPPPDLSPTGEAR